MHRSSEFKYRLLRRAGALLAGALVFSLTQTAGAEVRSEVGGSDVRYEFGDADLLGADSSSPYGSFLKELNVPARRVLLIRPRTSFVPEMLKSVEGV